MGEQKKKNTSENFDKEFSLTGGQKRSAAGKIPSWIMILAGAAIIAAVVIVKQPAIRPVVSGTKASVNSQSNLIVQGRDDLFSGSDTKADPSELEARFGSKNSDDYRGTAASFLVSGNDLLYNVQMDELPVDENGRPQTGDGTDSTVYWVDEKPFSVSLEPADVTDEKLAEAGETSVYWIDEKPYDVSLEQVSNEELAKLTDKELAEVVRTGDTYYRLQVAPAASSPDYGKSVSESSAAESTESGNEPLIANPEVKNRRSRMRTRSGSKARRRNRQPSHGSTENLMRSRSNLMKRLMTAGRIPASRWSRSLLSVSWIRKLPFSRQRENSTRFRQKRSIRKSIRWKGQLSRSSGSMKPRCM